MEPLPAEPAASQHPPPPRLHVLAKPTGPICNLDCTYCFYLDKEKLYGGSRFRMSDEVLERYIRQLIDSHRGNHVTVAWQGGEPTLMGLEFFHRVLEYERKYQRPGMTFENTVQTNGTLLDDDWCAFFKAHGFLIGISIDGPRELHDAYRVDKKGRPTFDKVMQGLRLLQKHGVEFNVLTTVNRRNADHPREVYRFLRDEVGTRWMQFIPVVERLDENGLTLRQEGATVSDRSVLPEQLGAFLSGVFDAWVARDVGRVYVQTFEAALRNWLGLPSSGMCVFDKTCGQGLVMEHNGDLYSCDHFVEPRHALGNLRQRHMLDAAVSEQQRLFGRDKLDSLPRACRECDVRFACHGECPKNRFLTTADGEKGLNYLCAGYKAFFRHIDHPMKVMAGLVRRGLPATQVMAVLAEEARRAAPSFEGARRNEPCPCGSGTKFKRCHGGAAGAVGSPRAGG
ncbi:anaerobic sulfatase maturase [Myxococcaceae bacterium GXIMD 01537]